MKLLKNKPLRSLGVYTLRSEELSFLFSEENWNLHGPVDYRVSHGIIYRRGQPSGLSDNDLVDTGKTATAPSRSTLLNAGKR